MAITSKREVARVLRIEADNIKRHGLDDVSTYTYDCIQAQALRGERCTNCLLRDFVPESSKSEEYPCQHIETDKYAEIISAPGMKHKIVTRLKNLAMGLEAAELAEKQ